MSVRKLLIFIIPAVFVPISIWWLNSMGVFARERIEGDYLSSILKLEEQVGVEKESGLLEKLIIGNWDGPPYASFEFKENNIVLIKAGSDVKTEKWKLKNNILSIQEKESAVWKDYVVKSFTLSKKTYSNKYKYVLTVWFENDFYNGAGGLMRYFEK